MIKSQFNIKISKDLLSKVKRHARVSGKSLTEHITDLIKDSLSEKELINDEVSKIKDFEKRLISLESIVSNREYLSKKFKPFNNSEAINCSKFMRGFFDQEVESKNFENKNQAFNEFLPHVNAYVQMSKFFTDRLKEVILSDTPTPWTGKELNKLARNDKCNCPIRKGLINWTGKTNCPSQQEICDKGEKLLPL